ncbi:MAG: type VI secretion system tip protein VgrG [Saprospiraceae bacterium]|uniref:Type VI secretion system tip protein VgrG n=1 Tax=Candidatus Opimibacter skivensis TaxID=2982028 RepID=A0A9D7SVB6_9BACT|nr:type VI secretion system tip protein VgrG [Candidatus Opimibacter skivensis]
MEELLIPNTSQHDVSSFDLLVNNNPINPAYEIMSLCITHEINRIPLAQIIIRDGDASESNFEISESDDLIPGKKITIKIGRDGNNEQSFKGIITKQTIKVKSNGDTALYIECRDESVKMTIGRKNKYHENVKDSQLVDDLVGQYPGLSADPQETTVTHKELVQHNISDWDFLLLRSEANGLLVNVTDGSIKTLRPNTSTQPALQVNYGSSVLEFEAEMDARSQWKNVNASSWDYANQRLFEADTSEASSFSQNGNIAGSTLAETINLDNYHLQHSGHVTEQELQSWVDGVMLRSRLAKIRGMARVSGFSGIHPGDMVKLTGVGKRFKGNAFVTGVRQEIVNNVWETHIQFGLDPERFASVFKDITDPLSAGLMGGIHGLQIGKVVHLSNDPDGEDRILVKIPTIDNNAQGIWSRVACLDAGEERGTFFRPELDDEVIVGFINDDPNDAIVLGMLNSSAKPAPLQGNDDNHEKGIFTRSKMRVHFNDQTKTITIDTPAGNSIKLDEQGKTVEIKDQNQNKVTMSTTGVKMESPKNIDIEAGVNLTLKAGASLTIGGMTLSIKADGNISMEGALAKLSASGITEVKGSLVKIN